MFIVMTRPDCPWCTRAKDLLTNYDIEFSVQEYMTDDERSWYKENIAPTFPTIFDDNGNKIGGYLDLEAWVNDNLL